MDTNYTNRGTWIVKFISGKSKGWDLKESGLCDLHIEIGGTLKYVVSIKAISGKVRQGKISEIAVEVLIAFWRGLRGEEILLLGLTGMIHFWEETTKHPRKGHVILNLNGTFKEIMETSGTC